MGVHAFLVNAERRADRSWLHLDLGKGIKNKDWGVKTVCIQGAPSKKNCHVLRQEAELKPTEMDFLSSVAHQRRSSLTHALPS